MPLRINIDMKYLLPLMALCLFLVAPNPTSASELTALQLQEYCSETDKGFLGEEFDIKKAHECKGYMMGFFDTMIVTEKFSKKPMFCVPESLPKTQNTLILNSWIKKNQKIAGRTTAAVALYSAYLQAFPCK